jgi:hypothetical protein
MSHHAPKSTDRTAALPSRLLQAGWLFALLLYALLAMRQLGLPGLHYDEAREAGQNAMELLTGAPVNAYRGAALELFGLRLPLMVQEYIGALNVYLALPSLWLTGIGVPNLRIVGILAGAATLILLERVVTVWLAARWGGARTADTREGARERARLPLSGAGVAAMLLLAASPSFVFWSRQGIFVTNLTQPLVLLMIWHGLRWRLSGEAGALRWASVAAGLALYAKLLAIWVVLPFALLLGGEWLLTRKRAGAPRLTWSLALQAVLLFALPLAPLILFNVQTGGTLLGLSAQVGTSYYGVNNADLWGNLLVRLPQLQQTLAGTHLWYLGGVHGNGAAAALATLAVVAALLLAWRCMLGPLLLVAGTVAMSLVTVSDLFITHYALLLPLLVGTVAIAGGVVAQEAGALGGAGARAAGVLLGAGLLLWVGLDLSATLRYHESLQRSGGLADHSDATYTLAAALRGGGYGAPIALDWGMDATVRFLSEGTVTPIEIFGYDSPAAPDDAFAARLVPFLERDDAVFLLRAPEQEVFAGRRAVLERVVAEQGATLELVQQFAERDGTPLFELWRVQRP